MVNWKHVAAQWLLNTGSDARSIPDLACQLLVDGYDTPSLRILAGESPDSSIHDLNPAFENVLRELGVLPESRVAAAVILAEEIARRTSSAEISELEGILAISDIEERIPEIADDPAFENIASIEDRVTGALVTFLKSEFVHLGSHYFEMPERTAGNLRALRLIVAQWGPPQALANLLLFLDVLPEGLRFAVWLRGMGEPWGSYLKHAALCGGHRIPMHRMSAKQLDTVRQHLLEILEGDTGLLAELASMSLQCSCQASDAPDVVRFLAHTNEGVAHNVLAWLLAIVIPKRTVKTAIWSWRSRRNRKLDALNELLGASVLPDTVRESVITKVREHLVAKERGERSTVESMVFAYMPNLNEWHPPMP